MEKEQELNQALLVLIWLKITSLKRPISQQEDNISPKTETSSDVCDRGGVSPYKDRPASQEHHCFFIDFEKSHKLISYLELKSPPSVPKPAHCRHWH